MSTPPNALPTTLADRVRVRINEGIADLITEEELKRMVDMQTAHYLQNELPKQIKEELQAKCKSIIVEVLNGEDYRQHWNHNGVASVSEAVKKMMMEHSGMMLVSMMESMVSMGISQLKSQAMNGRY